MNDIAQILGVTQPAPVVKRYAVVIIERSRRTYLVEAASDTAAEQFARDLYQDGYDGEHTGAEWSEIELVDVEELPPHPPKGTL